MQHSKVGQWQEWAANANPDPYKQFRVMMRCTSPFGAQSHRCCSLHQRLLIKSGQKRDKIHGSFAKGMWHRIFNYSGVSNV